MLKIYNIHTTVFLKVYPVANICGGHTRAAFEVPTQLARIRSLVVVYGQASWEINAILATT